MTTGTGYPPEELPRYDQVVPQMDEPFGEGDATEVSRRNGTSRGAKNICCAVAIVAIIGLGIMVFGSIALRQHNPYMQSRNFAMIGSGAFAFFMAPVVALIACSSGGEEGCNACRSGRRVRPKSPYTDYAAAAMGPPPTGDFYRIKPMPQGAPSGAPTRAGMPGAVPVLPPQPGGGFTGLPVRPPTVQRPFGGGPGLPTQPQT